MPFTRQESCKNVQAFKLISFLVLQYVVPLISFFQQILQTSTNAFCLDLLLHYGIFGRKITTDSAANDRQVLRNFRQYSLHWRSPQRRIPLQDLLHRHLPSRRALFVCCRFKTGFVRSAYISISTRLELYAVSKFAVHLPNLNKAPLSAPLIHRPASDCKLNQAFFSSSTAHGCSSPTPALVESAAFIGTSLKSASNHQRY